MSTKEKLKQLITTDLIELLSEASGIDLTGVDEQTEFRYWPRFTCTNPSFSELRKEV